MEFTTVSVDSADDMSEEELRETVSEFEDAQKQNLSEFKDAKETLDKYDDVDVSVTEAQEFKEQKVERLDEESPLEAEELSSFGLSRLNELEAEFVEVDEDEGDEVEDEDGDGEFSDMGGKGKTENEGDEVDDGLEAEFSQIAGLE